MRACQEVLRDAVDASPPNDTAAVKALLAQVALIRQVTLSNPN